jgi:hypothetical protein
MEHERPEKQLEFFRAVFREPTVSLWLRRHYAFLLRPADPEGGCLENTFNQQTLGSQEWRSATILSLEQGLRTFCMTTFGHMTFHGQKRKFYLCRWQCNGNEHDPHAGHPRK